MGEQVGAFGRDAGKSPGERRGDLRGGDSAELDDLAAGHNRERQPADVGAGENQHNLPGGLLERLEQRVHRGLGEVLGAVDQVDLAAAEVGGQGSIVLDGTDGLDGDLLLGAGTAGVVGAGRPIDGTEVGVGVGREEPAGAAGAAGAPLRLTQQGAREGARENDLADVLGPGQQVGVAGLSRRGRELGLPARVADDLSEQALPRGRRSCRPAAGGARRRRAYRARRRRCRGRGPCR